MRRLSAGLSCGIWRLCAPAVFCRVFSVAPSLVLVFPVRWRLRAPALFCRFRQLRATVLVFAICGSALRPGRNGLLRGGLRRPFPPGAPLLRRQPGIRCSATRSSYSYARIQYPTFQPRRHGCSEACYFLCVINIKPVESLFLTNNRYYLIAQDSSGYFIATILLGLY